MIFGVGLGHDGGSNFTYEYMQKIFEDLLTDFWSRKEMGLVKVYQYVLKKNIRLIRTSVLQSVIF